MSFSHHQKRKPIGRQCTLLAEADTRMSAPFTWGIDCVACFDTGSLNVLESSVMQPSRRARLSHESQVRSRPMQEA